MYKCLERKFWENYTDDLAFLAKTFWENHKKHVFLPFFFWNGLEKNQNSDFFFEMFYWLLMTFIDLKHSFGFIIFVFSFFHVFCGFLNFHAKYGQKLEHFVKMENVCLFWQKTQNIGKKWENPTSKLIFYVDKTFRKQL